MRDVEILRMARTLYAANPSHVPHPESPGGTSHCPMTALTEFGGTARTTLYLREAMGDPDSIVEWNAEHSTKEVLAAFDLAIGLAGGA